LRGGGVEDLLSGLHLNFWFCFHFYVSVYVMTTQVVTIITTISHLTPRLHVCGSLEAIHTSYQLLTATNSVCKLHNLIAVP
jgi:hypothetical protein